LCAEEFHTLLCDLYWVSFPFVTEEGALNFRCVHLKLLERTSSERISADKSDPPVLLHVVEGELGASGGLSGTLETDEHDHIRLTADKFEGSVLTTQHRCQLVYHCFLDKLLQAGPGDITTHVEHHLGFDCFLQLGDILDVHVGAE